VPIFVKDKADGLWKQGNNPTSKLLFVRIGQQWRSVGNTWLRQAGAWSATDYVGVPGAPTGLTVTSAANNFSTLSLAWTAPTSGAPVDHYVVRFYNQAGALLVDVAASGLSMTQNIAIDTYYQVEVFAVSAAGIWSVASNRVKYKIGHPQQTRQDPVYGWGSPYDAETTTVYASTTAVVGGTTYHGAYATDYNWSTYWAGGSRSSTTYFDALRVQAGSGYTRLYSVKVWPAVSGRFWLGLAYNGSWYGTGSYPTNVNLWFDANARLYFAHNYL
jgi:hypothetical protein